MSKLIAVCGSPESGKTTLGLKLAQELYFTKKTSVLFLSVDLNVPIMAHRLDFTRLFCRAARTRISQMSGFRI